MVWRRWRRQNYGTCSPLVHGHPWCCCGGAYVSGPVLCSKAAAQLAAALCSVLMHWCLARTMCLFSRGLCLGPHVRSQPRHAWPFRRARSVGTYVRPPLYSAALVPASAAMWQCCECWLDSMQRACFPLTGVVFKQHVGWWPSKQRRLLEPGRVYGLRPVTRCAAAKGAARCAWLAGLQM